MPLKAKTERECVEEEIHHLYHARKYSKNRAVAASLNICRGIFGKKKGTRKRRGRRSKACP